MKRFVMLLSMAMFAATGVPAFAGDAAPAAAAPASAVTKPTTVVAMKDCVSGDCHAGVKKHQQIHGPVNVNACDACHTLADAKTHKFTLLRSPDKLCTFCHQMDTAGAKIVHKPLATGQCQSCHDPHGGFDRNLLRAKSMGDLCKTCHQNMTKDHKSIHGPVAAGACGACHQPHLSANDHLLVKPANQLCLTCHTEMGDQLKHVQFAHKPVTDGDCIQCHDPHASDNAPVLKAAPLQLCTTCHADIRKAAFDAKYKHSAVTEGRACVNCHTAHGGNLSKLLKDQPITICMKCHSKDITQPGGEVVHSVAEITQPGMYLHGPLKEGGCGGCHNVHGSDVSRLLAKPYPEQFYASFKVDDYGLCFTCHSKDLATQKDTRSLTGFRNGSRNLHSLHVDKESRGRTCRACHSTHASTQPMHVRESVPYGNWTLPISYTPSKTGGSCSPGCHKPLDYDRDHPVDYKAPPPPPPEPAPAPESTPAPAPAPAPSSTEVPKP